ncbi:MAG: hypothetical protein ACLRSW_05975 [Christensenellaceae bacterium]
MPNTTIKDIDDILFVGEERTYKLIEHMFFAFPCFSSRSVHIGMDEAFMLGRESISKKRFGGQGAHHQKASRQSIGDCGEIRF